MHTANSLQIINNYIKWDEEHEICGPLRASSATCQWNSQANSHLKPPSLQALKIDILAFPVLKYYKILVVGPGLRRHGARQPAAGCHPPGPWNPFKTFQNHSRPFQTIHNESKPLNILQNRSKSSKTIKNRLRTNKSHNNNNNKFNKDIFLEKYKKLVGTASDGCLTH